MRKAQDRLRKVEEGIAAAAVALSLLPTLFATVDGRWESPRLVLTGVSTDCCVISTALSAADAGATLTVVTDACAGSTPENHRKALDVLSLYPPQITLTAAADVRL